MNDKVMDALDSVEKSLSSRQVKIGVLEGATYPDGTSVAMVAIVQEYGKIIYQPARVQALEFKEKGKGSGIYRFAKKGKGTFSQDVTVGAHAFWIPPRPFFRNAITAHEKEWYETLERGVEKNIDTDTLLASLGELIAGQVRESISVLNEPPIKNSTWRARKARGNSSDKPLVDTKVLINSIHYEVGEIEPSQDSQ